MIRANNYRIGNIVKCKVSNDSGVYTVVGIDGYIKVPNKNNHDNYERLIKIYGGARDNESYPESKLTGHKITEKWLLDFGFTKSDITHKDGSISKGVFKKECIVATFEDKFCIISRTIPSHIIEWNYLRDIIYVHELQNLYFAIRNEELQTQN